MTANQFTKRFSITTDAIGTDGHFDPRYTCDLDNSSPELRWSDEPEGTAGFAVIAEDPDAPAGLFTHWLVYGIPSSIHHLPAGVPAQELLPNGICQGVNSFGKLGYGGPCPPFGHGEHHYIFRVYALKSLPQIPPRASRDQLLTALQAEVLATAEVAGRYGRAVQKAG